MCDQAHTQDNKQHSQLQTGHSLLTASAYNTTRTHVYAAQTAKSPSFQLVRVEVQLDPQAPSQIPWTSAGALSPFNIPACTLTAVGLHSPASPAWCWLANRHGHPTVTGRSIYHTDPLPTRYSYPNPGPPPHQLVQPGICYQIIHIHNLPPHTGMGKTHKQPSPSSSCHPGLTSHTPTLVVTLGCPPAPVEQGRPRGTFNPVWLQLLVPNPLVSVPPGAGI